MTLKRYHEYLVNDGCLAMHQGPTEKSSLCKEEPC